MLNQYGHLSAISIRTYEKPTYDQTYTNTPPVAFLDVSAVGNCTFKINYE